MSWTTSYTCDRCGAKGDKAVFGARLATLSTRKDDEGLWQAMDLCEGCQRELLQWAYGGGVVFPRQKQPPEAPPVRVPDFCCVAVSVTYTNGTGRSSSYQCSDDRDAAQRFGRANVAAASPVEGRP